MPRVSNTTPLATSNNDGRCGCATHPRPPQGINTSNNQVNGTVTYNLQKL